MTTSGYSVHIRPRWSDMDAFGHVNHANVVTLLEEARVPLLFDAARDAGLLELRRGIVVVRIVVNYHAPILAAGHDLRVDMSLDELKAASFTLSYTVHNGRSKLDKVAVTAQTVLAPYDVVRSRPRRLSSDERAFLREQLCGADDA